MAGAAPSPSALLAARFEEWMVGAGISYDAGLLAVSAGDAGCGGVGLAVRAAAAVPEGAPLCLIPKVACLSTRTAAAADILEGEGLGGGLGLVVAVLSELARGAASPWHGYFAALPPREYIPLFWSESELELLQGTELEERAAQDRRDGREEEEGGREGGVRAARVRACAEAGTCPPPPHTHTAHCLRQPTDESTNESINVQALH